MHFQFQRKPIDICRHCSLVITWGLFVFVSDSFSVSFIAICQLGNLSIFTRNDQKYLLVQNKNWVPSTSQTPCPVILPKNADKCIGAKPLL